MQIKTTTALKKISGLKKRIWTIQGGQGAGKTVAILIILVNYAYKNPGKEIYIASDELSKMKVTVIKDFFKVLRSFNLIKLGRWRENKFWQTSAGSTITFLGLDKEDVGKGLRSDIIYINEANKIGFETYSELVRRAKRVIIDYNPNKEFWAHTDVIIRNDCDKLILTYNDNEHIPENEKKEILRLKELAYINTEAEDIDKPDNIKSKYYQNKWHIYGRGIVGTNPNRIFYWQKVKQEEFNNLEVTSFYGVDWGTVHPMGIIQVKYYDGALYIDELNYLSENQILQQLKPQQKQLINQEDQGVIKWLFSRLNIPKDASIICDNNRTANITALRKMGYSMAIAAKKGKGSILSGIALLNSIDVYYTDTSKNIEKEVNNYCRKVDRYGVILEEPEDEFNHLCDPCRYVGEYLQTKGIIKTR